jgi:hypothetical protein
MEGVNEMESEIKPEINRAYYIRFRPGARPDECVAMETDDRGVRIGRLP